MSLTCSLTSLHLAWPEGSRLGRLSQAQPGHAEDDLAEKNREMN